ncbi:MAG: RHS repeat-associated core domain-containing protein [Pseudolysinimonas sp.]
MRKLFTSTAAVAAIVFFTVGGVVDPVSAAEHARLDLAANTLAEALAAAATPGAQSLPEADVPSPDPVAQGAIDPGEGETVQADAVGATVDFSGFKVAQSLDVTVSKLPDAATTSAEAELDATVVSAPFEVTALTGSGDEVTQFPADPTIEKIDGVDVVTDVDPGVALDIAVDSADVADLDPASLRIVTREDAGQPWQEIPSYYDAVTGSVKGEIDHLSQFVVIGTPFVPPPGPRIVLDPDDNVGHTTGPGGPMTELTQNVRLANDLAQRLTEGCLADVLVTRTTDSPDFLSQSVRAGMAASFNPNLTLTVAFNAFIGSPWGGPDDGGSIAYSRGGGQDDALQASLVAQLPGYTGRPARGASSSSYPYSEFDGLPGAMGHLETLFMDHNYDRPVIDNGFNFITSGVFTGIGMYLETQGFDCTDPVTGGWPARPSDAELAKWRNLGYQNYLTYGGDPVSFSTGNLLEDEPIFTLTGVGGQALDLTLVYNSQDGRLTRTGAGWNFGLTSHAQRFDDGSVLVVRGDGASFVFEPDGTGGYTTEDGLHLTLTEAAGGMLLLTAVDGESWLFDASDIEGIGELVTHTDRQGNSYTLGYDTPDKNDQFVPLASITDQAGQVVTIGHDDLGRISSFTHPDGRVWSLGYSPAGDLVSITNPDGRVRTFTYDAAHQMLTATDAAGVTYLVNEYDASGRVVNQWDAEHNLRTFNYDVTAGSGGTTTSTDNEGNPTVFTFDEKSRITKVTDALGLSEQYVYDADNQVTKYTDQRGKSTLYEYDARGNVITKTTADGAVVRYTYTPTGEVASITDQGGPAGATRTTTFAVDAHGLTTGVTRADGSQVSNVFDLHGDLTMSTDPAGGSSAFGYDSRGNLTSLTDQLGRVTSFSYDLANRLVATTDPAGGVTSFVWDSGDRLTQQTDPLGGVTAFTYDANDHPLTRTDPDGAVTTYAWDDMFRVVSVTAPDGGQTRYEYNAEDKLVKTTDALGQVTTMSLDDLYRPTTVTDAKGQHWTRTYDATGNVLTATDPLGATTSFAYDAVGRLVTTTDATGAVSTTSYDQVGRTTQETDALGQNVAYKYDVLDRLTRVTDQAGQQTQYGYDPLGNVTQQLDRRGNSTTYQYDAASQLQAWSGPLGTGSSFDYDSRGNTIASTDALGRTSTLVFDALSRPVSAADPLGDTSAVGYDPMGRVTTSTDPNGHTSTYHYDLAGRLTSSVDPLGNTTTHTWNVGGQQTTMKDADNRTTTYAYDPLGQLTAVTEGYVPLPAPAGTDVNVTTQFQYTATGNVATITDPVGAVTQFQYDVLGRTTQETNPIGKIWHYSYDALGRPTQKLDAKGQTTSYQYTSRSDVSQIHYADGSQVTYQYDQAQNLIAMTDTLGASGWIFDAAGRMTKQTDSLGAVLQHAYDAAGQQTGMTLPGGQQVAYQYDAAGRPIKETSSSGSLAYAYDAASNLTDVLRSTGVTSAYQYDADNRVTGITHKSPGAELGCDLGANDLEVGVDISTLVDLNICLTVDVDVPVLTGLDYGDSITLAYTYTGAGDVASQSRKDGSAAAVNTTYAYDRLHRLTASTASSGTNNSYKFDKAGNRTQWVTNKAPDTGASLTVNATYDAAGELKSEAKARPGLLGSTTATTNYGYDSNGNRITAQTGAASTTYKYTPDDKLAEVNQAGRKVTTKYDGMGRALSNTTTSLLVLAQTTTQVWDGLTVVQQTAPLTGTSNLIRDAATGDVAIQTGTLLAGGTKWGLTDRLGSTIGQTSGSKVGQLAKYSDWGVPTFQTLGFTSKTGYTGELGDTTTGLDLFYARAYEPMSGSWLSSDPYRGTKSDPGTLGRYGYVGGNPATFADLYGYVTNRALADSGGHGLAKMKGSVDHGLPGVESPSSNTSRNSARHQRGGLSDVSAYSYALLAQWTASSESTTLYSIGHTNPQWFNDNLGWGMDVAQGNWWSAVPLGLSSLSYDGAQTIAASKLVLDQFQAGGPWDLKVNLHATYGLAGSDYVGDVSSGLVRADVFGNVNYGAMLALYGVTEANAVRASNLNIGSTGAADPADDPSIRLGYEMVKQYPNGMTSQQYLNFVLENGPLETVKQGEGG